MVLGCFENNLQFIIPLHRAVFFGTGGTGFFRFIFWDEWDYKYYFDLMRNFMEWNFPGIWSWLLWTLRNLESKFVRNLKFEIFEIFGWNLWTCRNFKFKFVKALKVDVQFWELLTKFEKLISQNLHTDIQSFVSGGLICEISTLKTYNFQTVSRKNPKI